MKQQSFFSDNQETIVPQIDGLSFIEDFITKEQEAELIKVIDSNAWNLDLKRRVQQYGYKYNYQNQAITKNDYLGELPLFLKDLADRLVELKIFEVIPNQAIINEYLPGQGISAHIDSSLFGSVICSMSLGSECVLDFTCDKKKDSILLKQRSLLVLKDNARFLWKHSIPSRKTDLIGGRKVNRTRRISITFRTFFAQ